MHHRLRRALHARLAGRPGVRGFLHWMGPAVVQDWRRGEGIRDHRTVGRRKGDADPRAASAACQDSSCRSPRPRALRARARSTGATTTSWIARSSTAAPSRASSSSTRPTAATATGRCAPRSSAGSPTALGGPGDRGAGRPPGARRDARVGPGVHRAAGAGEPSRAPRGRGTDSAEQIDERLRTAEIELAAQEEFQHVVVNDEVERAAASWKGSCAKSWIRAEGVTPTREHRYTSTSPK